MSRLRIENKIVPTAAAAFLLGGTLAYLYACIEARRYQLERLSVDVLRSQTFDPLIAGGDSIRQSTESIGSPDRLSILHLSDLHLRKKDDLKVDFLRRVTDADYDLVVLTGDIFEDDESIVHAANLLKRKPRLGAYAVMGNHDYYTYNWYAKTLGRLDHIRRKFPRRDVAPLISSLESAGYTVLRNEMVRLADHSLSIIGIDYPFMPEAQLANLAESVPADDFVLALFHLPHKLDALDRAGVHLAFGGHTHGGQVRIPGYGALFTDSELPTSESAGLIKRGMTTIHISRGLGADPRTNFRFFCPPAATVLDIKTCLVPSSVVRNEKRHSSTETAENKLSKVLQTVSDLHV